MYPASSAIKTSTIGLSEAALKWFENYLSDHTQCVSMKNYNSPFLQVNTGVPQGSVLPPLLFSIYINDLDHEIDLAKIHLYSDDTIIYTTASFLYQALKQLQNAFQVLQHSLLQLKLVLNFFKSWSL